MDKYSKEYFNRQSSIGEFGGWANLDKFQTYISHEDTVLDFGCGGGYLLDNIDCKEKIGIEVNPIALENARKFGIKVYFDIDQIEEESVNVIISNHALEHVQHPLMVLQKLWKIMKTNGTIVFVIPCETIKMTYHENDNNHHLYSWGPLTLGNLFKEAGFSIVESKPYMHKWPPKYRMITKLGGKKLFNFLSKIYARIERTSFQVRIVGKKD